MSSATTDNGRKARLRWGIAIGILPAVAAGLWILWPERATEPTTVAQPPAPRLLPSATVPSRPMPTPPAPEVKLPGEMILANYGSPDTRPQDDLTAVARALDNLALLVKGNDPFRLGANEEFAAALLGKNRAQIRFLPDKHPALNEKGQLVDRWQTPLYIHASSHDRLEIRSAGPDKVLWTADDLQRQPDGQFLKGEALNPASLYQQPTAR